MDKEQLISEWPPPDEEEVENFTSSKNKEPPLKRLKLTRTNSTVPTALVSLASWWRTQDKEEILRRNDLSFADSTNPHTILHVISKLPEAKAFLAEKVIQFKCLKDCVTKFMLASYYELLGQNDDALALIEATLEDIHPSLLHLQQLCVSDYLNQLVHLPRYVKDGLHALERLRKKREKHFQPVVKNHLNHINQWDYNLVERVDARHLTVDQFQTLFENIGKPVIITNISETNSPLTKVLWNFGHIKDVAGMKRVTLRKLVPQSLEWAKLEDGVEMTLCDFINRLQEDPKCPLYLFDWALPLHAPELAAEINIPVYFRDTNILSQSSPGSLYKESWPSLFVGGPTTRSETHVDAFGSSFWMGLVYGQKRWIFFPPEEATLLYPQYGTASLDPVFNADISGPKPDLDRFPLLGYTHPRECVLNPGEILFVPAGSPHRVENLSTSIAVSGNLVTKANLKLAVDELKVCSLINDRASELLKQWLCKKWIE